MSNIITESELTRMYHSKKNSCKQRLIHWEFSLEEFIALFKMRSVLTCFYTDRKFNLRDHNSKDYPTLERIDDTKAYSKHNTVFCTKHVNTLKANYIEADKSTKGLGEDIHVIQRIKKVLDNPDMIIQRLKPYQEIFDKIDQRHEEEVAKETQRVERQEASEKQKKINKVKAQMDEQRALASHYIKTVKCFEAIDVVYGLSIKDHRDKFRKQYCGLSGIKFESLDEKLFWVPNIKSVKECGVVTKDDFIVTNESCMRTIDNLQQCGNLKTIALNALKHI